MTAHHVHIDTATGRRTVSVLHPPSDAEVNTRAQRIQAMIDQTNRDMRVIDTRAMRVASRHGFTRRDYRAAVEDSPRFRNTGRQHWRRLALAELEAEGQTFTDTAAMLCGIDR